MMRRTRSRWHALRPAPSSFIQLGLALALLAAAPAGAQVSSSDLHLVPERERPVSILYQPPSVRRTLQERPDGQQGLERLRGEVRERWRELRELDLVALSRGHGEATRGYRLPAAPGTLEGQVVGLEEATGRLFLELRGPRLPATYDIVHRHLFVYASYDPTADTLADLTITIRAQVLE